MAWLDYGIYISLGYTAVPADSFPRFEGKAEDAIAYYLRGAFDGTGGLTGTQQRGLCEVTDLLYLDSTGALPPGPVSGFSNGKYSESYTTAAARSVDEQVLGIIDLYFYAELADARVLASEGEWAAAKHDGRWL